MSSRDRVHARRRALVGELALDEAEDPLAVDQQEEAMTRIEKSWMKLEKTPTVTSRRVPAASPSRLGQLARLLLELAR